MTVKTTRLGGTNWADGDVLYAADQNDTITRGANEPWYKILATDSDIDLCIISWSTTRFQTQDGLSTDTCATWAAGGYSTAVGDGIAAIFGAAGVSADSNLARCEYTTDSGANWNGDTVGPDDGNMTDIYCMAMGSATVAVCGGDAGANKSIYYTADGGDNWTEATTGTAAVVPGICMGSSTIGYAITVGNDIWKTTDSGVNWTDTTDNASCSAIASMYAIDTNIVLILTDYYLYHYVNSTNTVTTLYPTGDYDYISNIVKASNGNYYFLLVKGNSVYLGKYDGSNVSVKPITNGNASAFLTNTNGTFNSITTQGDVIYMVAVTGSVMAIDVQDE